MLSDRKLLVKIAARVGSGEVWECGDIGGTRLGIVRIWLKQLHLTATSNSEPLVCII